MTKRRVCEHCKRRLTPLTKPRIENLDLGIAGVVSVEFYAKCPNCHCTFGRQIHSGNHGGPKEGES